MFANERAAHARDGRRATRERVGPKKAHSDRDIEYASLLRQQGHSYAAVSTRTGTPSPACTAPPRTRRDKREHHHHR